MQLFLGFFVALTVTMILMPLLIRAAVPMGFVDVPDARKIHSGVIPRVGGVAMGIGTLLAMLVLSSAGRTYIQEFNAILFALGVILAFGAADDRFTLNHRVKFAGQFIAALIVVLVGDVVIDRLLIWDGEPMPRYLSVPFTIFAIMGATNAVNMSDGLDGLAGGTTLLSLGAIGVLAYMAGGTDIALIALATMGSILGFLRFNTHPARAFMGDAGSQFLGFSVGTLAVVLTQRVHTTLSTALPLWLLGLPIVDTLAVMSQRIREGRSPFSPDKNHIHHKLLARGFDHYEAVLIVYSLQAFLVAFGYYFRYQSDWVMLFGYFVFCVAVVLTFRVAEQTNWRFYGRAIDEAGTFVSSRVRWLRENGRIQRWVFGFLTAALTIYLLAALALGQGVSRDIGMVAMVLLVLLVIMYAARRGQAFHTVERAGLYIVCAFAVYLAQMQTTDAPWLTPFDNAFFGVLGTAVLIAALYCWKDRFELTPLDFLVLFLVLMVPSIPSELFPAPQQQLAVMKLIVLFYVVELLLYRFARRPDPMRLVTVVGLAAVGLRGLF